MCSSQDIDIILVDRNCTSFDVQQQIQLACRVGDIDSDYGKFNEDSDV